MKYSVENYVAKKKLNIEVTLVTDIIEQNEFQYNNRKKGWV